MAEILDQGSLVSGIMSIEGPEVLEPRCQRHWGSGGRSGMQSANSGAFEGNKKYDLAKRSTKSDIAKRSGMQSANMWTRI